MKSNQTEEVESLLKPLYDAEFYYLSNLVYQYCGINLHEGKRELVRSRLCGRLRKLGMDSFEEYCDSLKKNLTPEEITTLIDILSTNLTKFFRENSHFEFVTKQLPEMAKTKKSRGSHKLRIWSTACSSGEEPYSLAIVIAEALAGLPHMDAKILATDISSRMLKRAVAGLYSADKLSDVPAHIRAKYFHLQGKHYRVNEKISGMIAFRKLNVVGSWPFKGPFDIIFCRNMMIYFDKETQKKLVDRFAEYLTMDGFLFLGHSESLVGLSQNFKYVEPSIYRRVQ
jgi:chemotaxis protein methyltransferase CheR